MRGFSFLTMRFWRVEEDTALVVNIMYQYMVVAKLVDTCIVVVANQPKKPIKQGARQDARVG